MVVVNERTLDTHFLALYRNKCKSFSSAFFQRSPEKSIRRDFNIVYLLFCLCIIRWQTCDPYFYLDLAQGTLAKFESLCETQLTEAELFKALALLQIDFKLFIYSFNCSQLQHRQFAKQSFNCKCS